ncbi:MAG: ATP-binding protein [Armatimonadota bacterium]
MSDMQAQPAPRRIAFSFPATPTSISDVRHLIVSEARTLPFTEQDLEDIELAVSEAFTNLVQHAQGYRIRGVCEVNERQLEIRFEVDQSLASHLHKKALPSATAFGGRGIPLLHLLIPTVEICRRENGSSELRMVKPVSNGERAL